MKKRDNLKTLLHDLTLANVSISMPGTDHLGSPTGDFETPRIIFNGFESSIDYENHLNQRIKSIQQDAFSYLNVKETRFTHLKALHKISIGIKDVRLRCFNPNIKNIAFQRVTALNLVDAHLLHSKTTRQAIRRFFNVQEASLDRIEVVVSSIVNLFEKCLSLGQNYHQETPPQKNSPNCSPIN
jgi:hypothetical protein